MIILALLLTAKNNLVPMLFSLKLLLEEESLTTLMLVPQIPHLMIHQLVLQHEYSSSKIKAVLEVQSHCKVESPISGFNGSKGSSATSMAYSNSSIEGPIKAIVFSQWSSMLDLVEISLNQYCIQYRRLDGTLTLSSRDRTVKDLNTDPKVWPLPHEFLKQS
jgi:SNF2 family DNA or RNA helicase